LLWIRPDKSIRLCRHNPCTGVPEWNSYPLNGAIFTVAGIRYHLGMSPLLIVFIATVAGILIGAGLLHALTHMGSSGKALAAWFTRAPGLDLLITYFTVLPMGIGLVVGGRNDGLFGALAGLVLAVAGQVVGVMIWTVLHEFAHREVHKGPRIVYELNRNVGRVRNHTAVWITSLAVPIFWFVRLGEYVIYPPLTWVIRLPKYNDAEWVNVSRQKFDGLVGHDLIWCLYCDWMTGIWSLGSEMLRNIESFWCPIRFSSTAKCENCKIDFPDVENTWVPADGTIADVATLLHEKMAEGNFSWHGHPTRLTVEGESLPESAGDQGH